MKALITGGTGFIGSALARRLLARGDEVTVLSRRPASVNRRMSPLAAPLSAVSLKNLADNGPEQTFDCVINLAGAPIFGWPWTVARKKVLTASRVQLTDALVAALQNLAHKPKLLISGSATGYYGDQGDAVLTEDSKPAPGFSHELCAAWESAALKAESLGVRVCLIRTSPVLGQGGGLLARMALPFRLGLGGRLGSGRQWLPWIHLEDWLGVALAMIDDASMRGPYNAAAPNPVTHAELTEALARLLQRPALLPVPAALLKLLLGEMSELVLDSQRVLPRRLQERGFRFQYPDLAGALEPILKPGPR